MSSKLFRFDSTYVVMYIKSCQKDGIFNYRLNGQVNIKTNIKMESRHIKIDFSLKVVW